MRSTVIGPYPRVSSEYGDALRRALNASPGNIDVHRIEGLQAYLTQEVVREMAASGIDVPNCGLIGVHDELTWPLEHVEGVAFGGMKKIFHTNTHYREPVVHGEVARREPLVSSLYRAAAATHPAVKLEFPGPYTMAQHSVLSDGSPYKTLAELARAYARVLREELSGLGHVPLVQFNEPSIVAYGRDHGDVHTIPELYETMLAGTRIPAVVWTSYGRYSPDTLEMLLSLPVDAVGLDFVWDPSVKELLSRRPTDKGIGIGIIDSGDRGYIGLENADSTARQVKALGDYVDLSSSFLSTNATLEHLPRDRARQKVALIGEVTRRVNA